MDFNLPIYILNVHPIIIPGEPTEQLVYDLYYLEANSKVQKCIRIYNVELSFMVARYPGLTLSQFMRYLQPNIPPGVTTKHVKMRDGSYFSFGNDYDYIEFTGKSPNVLNNLYKTLQKECVHYYKQLDVNKLSPYDRLFYDNTETPFRYTSTSLSVSKSTYILPCKYNIPLIGGAKINTNNLTNSYPMDLLPSVEDIKGLDFKNISSITRDDTVDFKYNMTMLSYDIETWNDGTDIDNPDLDQNFIFCIGVGVFNLNDQKPEKRYCIMSKEFTNATFEADTEIPMKVQTINILNKKGLIVFNEYSSEDNNDYTTYIFTNNEKDLLHTFIKLINKTNPQIINGFNSFAFDDKYIYGRCKKFGLERELLQCYTPYNLDELYDVFWFRTFRPEFKQIDLKIDGEIKKDNKTIRSWMLHMVDVRKMMMKEDPKRFTQFGTSLNSMLETYGVKNPYTNKELSKTGLHIYEMFRRWKNNENLYSIALYCVQDAWICGTLLIKRSKLTDLIEMANITNTLFMDSIYKADGQRVANTILNYAYNEQFALMDTPYEKRQDVIKQRKEGVIVTRNIQPSSVIVPLGGKKHDDRTIVGGQVRNVHAGRQWFVVALDYASMYPSAKEGMNLDSSSTVDKKILENPEKYGLKIVMKKDVNDICGQREVYYLKKV